MLRIALAQINSTAGDMPGNCDKIIRFIKVAEEKGADILVFPEMGLTGYPPEDLLLKPHFLSDCQRVLKNIAKHSRNICTLIGLPHLKGGSLYNSCAVIQNENIIGIYNKRNLPNYGVFDERRYFTAGDESLILQYRDIKLAVTICEDIWSEGDLVKNIAGAGVDILVNLSASPYHFGKVRERKKLARDFTSKNKIFIIYCNLVGGQDELVFDGGSFVCGRKDKFILEGPLFKEELLITDLELKKPSLSIPRTKLKEKNTGLFIKLKPSIKTRYVPIPSYTIKELGREEEVYEALILGLKDYVRKNGFKKVALGLSGGIDSALAAVLACDALGAENVFCISMPSPFSSQEALKDVKILARSLGVKLITLPIETVYRSYLDALKFIFRGRKTDIAEENIQARIRGNLLMALSNKFGWLILATGNKSEMSVGYATLYGDMAGGFAVLKDVYKTLVYELVNFRNKRTRRELIPLTIIKRSPSAELYPGQKDEDVLPPYSILDKILQLYIEKDLSHDEILKKGFKPQITRDVIQRVDRNEYKRRQSPPGIRITPKAFGKDRRMPITNAYREEENNRK